MNNFYSKYGIHLKLKKARNNIHNGLYITYHHMYYNTSIIIKK